MFNKSIDGDSSVGMLRARTGEFKIVLLSLLSVAFIYASFPGGIAPWLGWIALAPMGLALHGRKGREGFSTAFITALFGWMVSTWWIVPGIAQEANSSYGFATILLVFFCCFYALPYGIAGWLYCRFGWTRSISGSLYGALVFTAICCITPHILPGNLTHTQYLNPRVIQILDIGGMPLLFFIMHWFGWLCVTALVNWPRQRHYALRSAGIALLLLAVTLGYGHWRLDNIDKQLQEPGTTAIKVGWVQPNISITERNRTGWLSTDSALLTMTETLAKQHTDLDLIIWPEIPAHLSYTDIEADKRQIDQLIKNSSTPLLINSTLLHDASMEKAGYYNTVELITEAGLQGTYRKQVLLPFGEYLPYEEQLPILRQWIPGALNYKAGTATEVFPLTETVKLIPLICYETVFPELAAAGREDGGNLIINPVNDAWFGQTAGPKIHLALTLFRSVEFRTPIIRSTNSGISGVISASGKLRPETVSPLFQQTAMTADVRIPQVTSLYERTGNWFLWLVGIAALFMVALHLKRSASV